MKRTTWSLRQRISGLTDAVAVVLALIAVTAVVTAAANRADARTVMDRLTPALVDGKELETELLRQQSSLRTFTLTARDEDLSGYRDAIANEQRLLADCDRLLVGE